MGTKGKSRLGISVLQHFYGSPMLLTVSGKKPEALSRVNDPEVRTFVEKCLVTVSRRLSAGELLKDPFLQIDDYDFNSRMVECHGDVYDIDPLLMQPFFTPHHSTSSFLTGYSNHETEDGWGYDVVGTNQHGIEIFNKEDDDEHSTNVDISIKGKRRDDDGIFLRLRIADKEGRVRNIYFPFDIHTDTALSVATEMVAELDITDQDVTKIAEMIDGEISALVPDWKPGPGIEDVSPGFCLHCHSYSSSNGSLFDYLSSNNSNGKNIFQCPRLECASMHGRFEEITYQVEGSEHCVTEGAPVVSSQSDGMHYTDIWAQHEAPDLTSEESDRVHSDEESDNLDPSTSGKDETMISTDGNEKPSVRKPFYHRRSHTIDHLSSLSRLSNKDLSSDYENDIRQELRWLKAKYQMDPGELRAQQCGGVHREERGLENENAVDYSGTVPLHGETRSSLKSLASGNHFPSYFVSCSSSFRESSSPVSETQRVRDCEATQTHESTPDHMFTAKSFYEGAPLPQPIHRSRSLPLDAIDV